MLIKISETVMINPDRVSAVEVIPYKKIIIYVDGKAFNVTVPYAEIMPKLMALDETNQFWAGK